MRRPDSITNEPKWIVRCTKIRARALDLLEKRLSLFESAEALNQLAISTHAKTDPDLRIFSLLYHEYCGLPAGRERAHWAPHALIREDAKIAKLEEAWADRARVAAEKLVERYAWSLEARAALRRAGGSARDV
jgi:hypothetical protein